MTTSTRGTGCQFQHSVFIEQKSRWHSTWSVLTLEHAATGASVARVTRQAGASPNREEYPVECITWSSANDYCEWLDARLPSEAEWEYAARNQGQDVTFPWGEEPPTCSLVALAQCTTLGKAPVCSTPEGNTQQGLCDMLGSVREYVRDRYHSTYEGAPPDGSAREESVPWTDYVVIRGGSGGTTMTTRFRAITRDYHGTGSIGFRCAQSIE